ncbi:hypothetical protein L2E82_27523 [Cichorium intybus]|uniref:Uncharacterized protein n=1 Tax=Cichorium intybus TaxID=13427 RepID=A0ACB9CT58_CICIN|nr:hypothetical protein L2E82_27523 [Cichorium intybus]
MNSVPKESFLEDLYAYSFSFSFINSPPKPQPLFFLFLNHEIYRFPAHISLDSTFLKDNLSLTIKSPVVGRYSHSNFAHPSLYILRFLQIHLRDRPVKKETGRC